MLSTIQRSLALRKSRAKKQHAALIAEYSGTALCIKGKPITGFSNLLAVEPTAS
ncbi:MAG: hypothetical protein SGJ20_19675 [Planctomycetota bacterium]|nr:hypothetical protein [Planctomycetota bacterium]